MNIGGPVERFTIIVIVLSENNIDSLIGCFIFITITLLVLSDVLYTICNVNRIFISVYSNL